MNKKFLTMIVNFCAFFPCLVFSADGILPTPDYSGGLLNRSTLTGDWNGTRRSLAENGLHLDFRVTSTYQNLFKGGINERDGFVSTQDLLLQLDTGKAGLWPGGLLKLRVESRAGKAFNSATGGLSPVNNDALFPIDSNNVNDETIGLTEVTYTQFLSPQFGVFGGLLNTRDADANELAGSARSDSHFMNSAFLVSMVALRSTPSVTLGGGMVFIPRDWILGTIAFYDTEESSTHNPFNTGRGNTVATEWNFKHKISNLPGAQTFGFLYAFDNKFPEFGNDPRSTIRGLVTGNGLSRKSDTWAFYHSAHQYLQWKDGKGWGLFTRFGIADENSNPINMSAAVGISGNGIFNSRPNDAFGLGYYHLEFSNSAILGFLDIDDENGAELWYNAEITPWLHVTADIQVVDTALGNPGRGIIPPGFISVSLPESKTAWIFGLRTKIQF
jgi:porin